MNFIGMGGDGVAASGDGVKADGDGVGPRNFCRDGADVHYCHSLVDHHHLHHP